MEGSIQRRQSSLDVSICAFPSYGKLDTAKAAKDGIVEETPSSYAFEQVAALPEKCGYVFPQGDGFACVVACPEVPVSLTCRRSTSSAMMAADLPACDGG